MAGDTAWGPRRRSGSATSATAPGAGGDAAGVRTRGTVSVRWRRLTLAVAVVILCSVFWWGLFRVLISLAAGDPAG